MGERAVCEGMILVIAFGACGEREERRDLRNAVVVRDFCTQRRGNAEECMFGTWFWTQRSLGAIPVPMFI